MATETIRIFEDCVPVKGIKRSIIYDLGRNGFFYIPNDMYDLLICFNGKSVSDITNYYGDENIEQINEYLDFLFLNEIIFFSSNSIEYSFPKISMDWDFPSLITNAIIDIGQDSTFDFVSIVNQLEKLGCYIVQLRIWHSISIEELMNILRVFEEKDIKRVELILPYAEDLNSEKVKEIIEHFPRLNSVIIFNSPDNYVGTSIDGNNYERIIFLKEKVNEKNCGIINQASFFYNIHLFSESQTYNSCLNRKVSIDKEGNIRNCPSMKNAFGNIKDIQLEDAILSNGFKEVWAIRKDEIEICKNCEFRYACTDCRAFLEDPGNIYSKPLKCGYDPNTGEWQDWAVNPLKAKAIGYYKL